MLARPLLRIRYGRKAGRGLNGMWLKPEKLEDCCCAFLNGDFDGAFEWGMNI